MARVRRQQGTREALLNYQDVVLPNPQNNRGKWQEIFGNRQPIRIEIGMGRGQFIGTMARQNPQINFIGVEVVEEIVLYAVQKMEKNGGVPKNLRIIWINAQTLAEIFASEEVERIYLNFSDPWPKYKHRKRRLTHGNFLRQYADILAKGGEVHLKTDNMILFEFSLNEFAQYHWQLKNIQLDMYRKLPEDNVVTEYERKFVEQGMPIYRLEAVKPDVLP